MKKLLLIGVAVAATACSATPGTTGGSGSPPSINDFHAEPATIHPGDSVNLVWDVSNATTIEIDQGVGSVSGTTKSVQPSATTAYTLKATNSAGYSTSTTTVTVAGYGALQFNYTDPTSTTAKLKLVKNVALSTNDHIVLDLKVGANPVSAFGVALTIPFDAASVGMVAHTSSSGLSTSGSPINVGTNPTTATSKLGGVALGNAFTVGVAKHKSFPSDTSDVSLPAGSTLFSIAFDFGGTTPVGGTTVFNAAALQGNGKYKAAALHYDGTIAVQQADIAIGTLGFVN